jgi:hypothetical protein
MAANYVIPLDVSRQIADTLTGTGKLFDAAEIALYINNVTPGPLTALADLTLATFTGSSPQLITTWGAAYIGADGSIHLTAPSALFTATATPGTPQTVYGATVVGDPGGTPFLIAAWRFDTPVNIAVKYDGVVADVDIIIV